MPNCGLSGAAKNKELYSLPSETNPLNENSISRGNPFGIKYFYILAILWFK